MIWSVARCTCLDRVLAAFLVCVQSLGVILVSAMPSPSSSRILIQQQTTAQHPETIESLRSRIAAHIAQPRFAAALWGVKIVSLETGKTIFEHNREKYFNPASNAKLYTAALALDRLGVDHRIKTSLYSAARPDASGTLKADLIVYGRGDPT